VFFLSALVLGLCLSAMGLGIYITVRIFRIPDITTDGSFTLGAAVTAYALVHHWPLAVTLLCSIAAGALAGTATGLVHTKLRVQALLAGILVMTALYSVNLAILGRSNVPLSGTENVFATLAPFASGLHNELLVSLVGVLLLAGLLSYFLRSDLGIALRASGASESMARALGIHNDTMKIAGLAIANALTAISGFLVAQYQHFVDINMGIGIVLVGLGSVLIGEALIGSLRVRRIFVQLLCVSMGCVVFQMVLAFALSYGINPVYLKLVTALSVLSIVAIAAHLDDRRGNA